MNIYVSQIILKMSSAVPAAQRLDSRGNPTVKVQVKSNKGRKVYLLNHGYIPTLLIPNDAKPISGAGAFWS